jgi:hypothetical protein
VIDLPRRFELSIRQLSLETGIGRDAIRHRLTAANVRPSGQRGGHAVYRLRDALPAIYLAGADGEVDPDRLPPHERRAFYQGAHEKMRVQMMAGELIPRMEVERTFARAYKTMAQFLETLPDVLERSTASTPEQLRRLEASIDQLREELYEALIAEPGSEPEPNPEGPPAA